MKKINKSLRKEYLPVKIYNDDIERIVFLFDENNIKYSLETDQYKYDNLTELIERGQDKMIKSLEIKADEPYITIEFNKMWAKLYVSSDETYSMGLFHKIDSIINSTQRFFPFAYSYYFIWIINSFIIIKGIYKSQTNIISDTISISIYTLLVLWILRVGYIRLVRHSSIHLIKKEHATNFFQRKRDDLILAFISALVGAILGVAGTLLINQFL